MMLMSRRNRGSRSGIRSGWVVETVVRVQLLVGTHIEVAWGAVELDNLAGTGE